MKDWLTDPAIRALSRDERGRYIDVLARTHLTDHPGVCCEDDVRKWAGYSLAQWKKHREAFARLFTVRPDGTWIQESIIKARETQRKRFEQSSKGGIKSAAGPRDSRGRLEARLAVGSESGLDDGLGTHAVPPASASPTSKKNQPNPAARGLLTSQEHPTPNGAANETRGPKRIGDLLPLAISPDALRSQDHQGRDLTDAFIDSKRRRFPGVDVYAISAQIREEMLGGKITNPRGLLTHRCREAFGRAQASVASEATP